MLFGIKVNENKKGLKRMNDCLQKYGSAIMTRDYIIGIFLTNPFEALKVANHLKKANKYLSYKVFKLKNYEEAKINKKNIVNTYNEYLKLSNEKTEELNNKAKTMLDEINKKLQVENSLEK